MKTVFLLLFVSSRIFAVPAEGHVMMVSAPSAYAVETAKHIIAAGGNVADVAVAVGLTLAVTSPYYAALGGGGMALIHINGQTQVLNFRETAPALATENTFVDRSGEASTRGGLAVAVPGFPAGLFELHKKFGKLKWPVLFEQPLKLAQAGFSVSGEWVKNTIRKKDTFTDEGRRRFFKKNGDSFQPQEILQQPDLTKALRLFRDKKLAGFYSGLVAEDLVKTVQRTGGFLSLSDLKNYKAIWLEPLTTQFLGYKIYLPPPPSSGGVVIETALKLTTAFKLDQTTAPLSVEEFHLLTEILSRSFRSRSLLGDPQFNKNPIDILLSDAWIEKLTRSISIARAATLPPLNDDHPFESDETTHFSVLDHEGNAVAMTVTLNGDYGSGVVSKKYGIALNNEMDDFTTKPKVPNMFGLIQGAANRVEAGKRPLSSMSPVLVEDHGKIAMSLGAPGGPRIISAVFQVLYRVLARHLDMDQAIQAPRIHHQFLPNVMDIEADRFSPEVISGLKDKGQQLKVVSHIARVFGVRKNSEGILEAAFDSRGEGAAGGY